jgi:hypothetical protein
MPENSILIAKDSPEGKYDYYYDGSNTVFFNSRCKNLRSGIFGTLQLFSDFILNGFSMGVQLTEQGKQLIQGRQQ